MSRYLRKPLIIVLATLSALLAVTTMPVTGQLAPSHSFPASFIVPQLLWSTAQPSPVSRGRYRVQDSPAEATPSFLRKFAWATLGAATGMAIGWYGIGSARCAGGRCDPLSGGSTESQVKTTPAFVGAVVGSAFAVHLSGSGEHRPSGVSSVLGAVLGFPVGFSLAVGQALRDERDTSFLSVIAVFAIGEGLVTAAVAK